MPDQHDLDQRNDAQLLRALLLMAVIIAVGVLIAVFTGHALAATA